MLSYLTYLLALVAVVSVGVGPEKNDGCAPERASGPSRSSRISTVLATAGCVNANGDFSLGPVSWTVSSLTGWSITDGELHLRNAVTANTSFGVAEGGIYTVGMYLQASTSPVTVRVEYRESALAPAYYSQDIITFTPRGGSVYSWVVQAPVGAKTATLSIVNGATDLVRLDNVCITETPTASPLNLGCTNVRSDFEDGSRSYWYSSNDKETKVVREKGLRSLEISKEFTKAHTFFPARANKVYLLDLNVLGEKSSDKRTYISVEWEDLNGATVSTTKLVDKDYPDSYTAEEIDITAPNDPKIARGRLVFETRPSGKTWINRACVSERGTAGASSIVSGLVFTDFDRDGERDNADAVVGDVTTFLYRDNGDNVTNPGLDQLIGTQQTSVAGGYTYANLAAGTYYVLMVLPPTTQVSPKNALGSTRTDVDSDFSSYTFRTAAAAVSDMRTLTGASAARNVDLGLTQSNKSAVSGYVWADLNGDRLRNEASKAGLNGVIVESVGPLGTLRTETTFGPDGNPGYYLFNYVQPQSVRIRITLPGSTSLRAVGGDNSFDPATGQTAVLTLQPNVTVWNRSAALQVSATEVCDNRIDDDLDGRIDENDDDCSTCTVPAEVLCGEPYRHYLPPVWMMADALRTEYVGPAHLRLTTAVPIARVTVRNKAGTFTRTVTVTRTTPVSVALDERLIGQTSEPNTVQADRGILIESDFPVQGVYFVDGLFNKALVTLKGHQALGNRFRAGSQTAQYRCAGGTPGGPNVQKREAHFVSVVATENNTEVTFSFDASRLRLAGGITSPHTVILNAGESYLVRDDYTNQTVSGVLVVSDKAVSVVSGSQHTNVCDVGGLDAGIDQLVPECYVGKEYVAVKHKGHGNQHYAVVVPTVDNTEVYYDGSLTPVATLNAGAHYTLPIGGAVGAAHYIRTSAPAYVYHFSGISNNNEVGMAIAASVESCRGDRYLRFAKGSSGDQELSMILPTSALPSLKLNGVRASTLTGALVNAVVSKPTMTAVTISSLHLLDINTVEAEEPFQAALLIGISGASGTYGYLTSFSPYIVTVDPDQNVSPRYRLANLCAGESVTHTIQSSSCGVGVKIAAMSYNSSLGFIEQTGPLSFRYNSSATGGGVDNISIRLRDDNGLESSVCIDMAVCGNNVSMGGVPNDATLSCEQDIPVGKPVLLSTDCPQTVPVNYSDVSRAGACPQERTVVRTWTATTDCGLVVTRSRTFTVVDRTPPTFSAVPPATSVCEGTPMPTTAPSVLDACTPAGKVAVTGTQSRTDLPNTTDHDITRTWTATDECGNTATASQLVRVNGRPKVSATAVNATCGANNGELRVAWAEDANRKTIAITLNGTATAPLAMADRAYTFGGLAPGSYAIGAQWGAGECPVTVGNFTVSAETVSVGPIQIWDIDANSGRDIVDGATYHVVRDLPGRWNVRTGLAPTMGSLEYTVSGAASQTAVKNVAPYALPSGTTPITWRKGVYTIRAKGFTAGNATGASCASRTVTFTLVDFEICDNNVDDDGDGLVDACDDACPGAWPVSRVTH